MIMSNNSLSQFFGRDFYFVIAYIIYVGKSCVFVLFAKIVYLFDIQMNLQNNLAIWRDFVWQFGGMQGGNKSPPLPLRKAMAGDDGRGRGEGLTPTPPNPSTPARSLWRG